MIEKTSRFLIEICKKILKIEKSTIIQSFKVIFIGSEWQYSGQNCLESFPYTRNEKTDKKE